MQDRYGHGDSVELGIVPPPPHLLGSRATPVPLRRQLCTEQVEQRTWTDDQDGGEEANFPICKLQRVELGGHEEELIQELSHGHLMNHLTETEANDMYMQCCHLT